MKYLGIIIDKFKFSEHITYAAEKCTKFTVYPNRQKYPGDSNMERSRLYIKERYYQLLYGAPVWIEALQYKHNRLKYITVQRLINTIIAKAYRSVKRSFLHTDRTDPHRHKNSGGISILPSHLRQQKRGSTG